ncbi:histidine phosphotransferase [Rhodobacterales bacterium HKCCD6035]|nr:histidine phosphotransferase [Rhodobacterales bacterium HKCCD6035]
MSALVASRLCHDLGNPLGAVSNGVELLQMSGMANSPEMALIADALRDTEARLRFFRIAYGAARPDQHISGREARNILSQMYGAGRLTVDWLLKGDLPRHHVKSAFLMIACAEAALPMGGHITIAKPERGTLTVGADGPRILRDLSGLAWLGGASHSTPSPREVQFLILLKEAADIGAEISLSLSDTRVQISLQGSRL